jgi:hypothetical protein
MTIIITRVRFYVISYTLTQCRQPFIVPKAMRDDRVKAILEVPVGAMRDAEDTYSTALMVVPPSTYLHYVAYSHHRRRNILRKEEQSEDNKTMSYLYRVRL